MLWGDTQLYHSTTLCAITYGYGSFIRRYRGSNSASPPNGCIGLWGSN